MDDFSKIGSLLAADPHLTAFWSAYAIFPSNNSQTVSDLLDSLTDGFYEDAGIDRHQLLVNLQGYIQKWKEHSTGNTFGVDSITIIGGVDKNGTPEHVELVLMPGLITSIVGPTGSGKSRLLADIEWMAQGDTPSKRRILVNGKVPDPEHRFSTEHKLVAQLSQNMNFVMDTSVGEFIAMHAESRMAKDVDKVVHDIIAHANLLAGEPFLAETPITSLSGGQSRALMIADTAFLSTSPVVLIDEIENAGIDRKKALQLLVRADKIVLMATHDPILALMGDQRLVIKNGGIYKVIETYTCERENLAALEAMDDTMRSLRNRLRNGEVIEQI